MAQPSTRSELITYAKRQLGAPVLEINVADEQVEDILDDAIQYFQERHFDGVYPTFLKYKLTEDDITRGRSRDGNTDNIGITTIATKGNAVKFGNLASATDEHCASATSTRGFSLGGTPTPARNIVEYISIATGGTAVDFGDRTVGGSYLSGCSNGHGGLG